MSFSRIVYLPELLHEQKIYYIGGQRSMSSGFFNLIREPVRQGCGVEASFLGAKKSFGFNIQRHQQENSVQLSPKGVDGKSQEGFDEARFRELARLGCPDGIPLWIATYHRVNDEALDYLFSHLPQEGIVVSFEMSPWLKAACVARSVTFLDLRHSPLRFGRDLYIAMHTNDEVLRTRILEHQVADEELRLEASLLAANVSIHRGRGEENMRYYFDLEGAFIYVGQHAMDPALLTSRGGYLQCADHAARLRELAQGRRVLYLADWGTNLRSEENPQVVAAHARAMLAETLDMPVHHCPQSIYQVLGAHEDFVLAGLSAPTLQEAFWFDRADVHQLAPFGTPLIRDGVSAADGYVQVHFQDFISPDLWHRLLAPSARPPKIARLPTLSRHCGREMLDLWGDYEKVLTWQRTVPLAIFDRSGGGLLRERVDGLVMRQARESATSPGEDSPFVSAAAIARLKNSKVGQTAYVLGNGPSLSEFDIPDLMARESFWCNRAFEIEKMGLSFQPKYYFWADQIGVQLFIDEIVKVKAGIKFFRNGVYKILLKNRFEDICNQNTIGYECREIFGMDMHDGEENFSYDPSVMVFSGWTVVLDAVQFAYYMGYSRVYVGGVDLDFSGASYFFPTETNFNPMDCTLDNIRKAFVTAKNNFEKNGRVLAKITQSPNLPLEFFRDLSLIRVKHNK